jgi:hypothetical protein
VAAGKLARMEHARCNLGAHGVAAGSRRPVHVRCRCGPSIHLRLVFPCD